MKALNPHLLERHRVAVTARWRRLMAGDAAAGSGGFVAGLIDEFGNPAGAIISRAAAAIFDLLTAAPRGEESYGAIDELMKLRAVQCHPAGDALRFLSQLENECLETIEAQGCGNLSPEERAHITAILDEMAHEARDRYERCRERIDCLRARERERMRPRARAAASGEEAGG